MTEIEKEPIDGDKTKKKASPFKRAGCLIAMIIAAGMWVMVGISTSNYSKQLQGYQDATADKAVNALMASLPKQDSFFTKLASKQEFRGITEYLPCGKPGDRCLASTSNLYTQDNTDQVCEDFLAWATEFGATRISGPKDDKWFDLNSVNAQEKCTETLRGRVRWMPAGLGSEQILVNGVHPSDSVKFSIALSRTEELPDASAVVGPLGKPGQTTAKLVFEPKYSYTAEVITENHGSTVRMTAQSTSWKHQAAALLDIFALLRRHNPTSYPNDPGFTNAMIAFFEERYQYGGTIKPIPSADGQINWLDWTTQEGSRVCLSVKEPQDPGTDIENANAARVGLGGGYTAFQGLGASVDISDNEAKFGSWVRGGCAGMKQVPAHPERLIAINRPLDTKIVNDVRTTTKAVAKLQMCEAAGYLKARLDWLTSKPVADIDVVTVSQGLQLSEWADTRIADLGQRLFDYTRKLKGVSDRKFVDAAGGVSSTYGYLRQAGDQYQGRATNQQFRFARKTKNIGEYYQKTFRAPATNNDVGSFRFAYKPLMDYCGLKL